MQSSILFQHYEVLTSWADEDFLCENSSFEFFLNLLASFYSSRTNCLKIYWIGMRFLVTIMPFLGSLLSLIEMVAGSLQIRLNNI